MNAGQQERARAAAMAGGAGPATLVPALYTDYLPARLKHRARDFFAYQVQVLPLAAAGVGAGTFAVQNDSDFLAVSVVGHVTDPADEATVYANPAITLQVEDSGSGRQLFSQVMHWNQVVGTATLPGFLPYPKIFGRASTVTWNFQNLDAADDYNVRVAFMGFKIFEWDRDE